MNITLTPEQAAALQSALETAAKILSGANQAEPPQQEPEKPMFKRWRAEEGQHYYAKGLGGIIKEEGSPLDDRLYAIGDYHPTMVQSGLHEKHQIYTRALKDAAAQAWLDAEQAWLDAAQGWLDPRIESYWAKKKFFGCWGYKTGKFYIEDRLDIKLPNTPYFPTYESCKNAYTTILGDDLEWYITYSD